MKEDIYIYFLYLFCSSYVVLKEVFKGSFNKPSVKEMGKLCFCLFSMQISIHSQEVFT